MKDLILKLKTILSAKDFIVTGSFVLSEFGLIDKALVNDLDIVLIQPEQSTLDTLERLMKEFPARTTPKVVEKNNDPEAVKPPPLNKAFFMYDNVKVDIFVETSFVEPFLLVEGIKYCTIPHIILAKQRYGRMKDWLQCRDMARVFFKEELFTKMLDSSWKSALKINY